MAELVIFIKIKFWLSVEWTPSINTSSSLSEIPSTPSISSFLFAFVSAAEPKYHCRSAQWRQKSDSTEHNCIHTHTHTNRPAQTRVSSYCGKMMMPRFAHTTCSELRDISFFSTIHRRIVYHFLLSYPPPPHNNGAHSVPSHCYVIMISFLFAKSPSEIDISDDKLCGGLWTRV